MKKILLGIILIVLMLLSIKVYVLNQQKLNYKKLYEEKYVFKGMDMDIDCEAKSNQIVCILTDLHLKTKPGVNDWWFKRVTEGYGLCGTIKLPNKYYLNVIYCGENMTVRVD